MLAKIYAAQITGLRSDIVEVEVDVAKGLHSFVVVGLPDKAVEEAKDRITAAIKNSGFKSPQKSNKKVIVSLAPADLKKEGPVFDLAIALSYLEATGEVTFEPKGKLFIGELALDGAIRPIKGALMIAERARAAGYQSLYLPAENAREAALVRGIAVYPCRSLRQVIDHLSPAKGEGSEPRVDSESLQPQPETEIVAALRDYDLDFADVRGQQTAKRGLEIAAAGGHNIAMSGPPGTGKTMLAKALVSILPPLDFEEALEATGIHSAAGVLNEELVVRPPFRSPHHTASYVSLVGGGASPRPGEITLAHRGVLFLDEFPEFERRVVEALRQPLEDRVITVARAKGSMSFPASFMLVAAMNPCPCGNRGLKNKECVCTPQALARYQRKISGPIIDRIDLWLEVPQIDHEKLSQAPGHEEPSARVRERILAARERQKARFKNFPRPIKTNSEMGARELSSLAVLNAKCTSLLNESAKRLDLSARAYHRVIKLARTIADLAGAGDISENHLLEALQYRPKNSF